MLDCIARQLVNEQEDTKIITQEAHFMNPFLSVRHVLLRCHSLKTKYNTNLPTSFEDASQYPGWRSAIDREYNAVLRRRIWSYVKLQTGMTSVLLRLKPLDADGKNLMEKDRCYVRGDRQLAYVDYDPYTIYAPVT